MLVILCTLLKVYLPACSSHIVATSNHTRVCLHSVEFPHTQDCLYMSVCVFYVHLICLCVPKSAVAGVTPHSGLFVYNYVCVLCAFYLFVCTQVSCCWSHSTLRVVCI